MRGCWVLSHQLCEQCATGSGAREEVVDRSSKDNVVIEKELKRCSLKEATFRSPQTDKVIVEILSNGKDDSLGIVVEARVPRKPLNQTRDNEPELDYAHVTMEIVSITPGGAVDRHNSIQSNF